MQSGADPTHTTTATQPGVIYRELRKRNERRARVAHLLEARRKRIGDRSVRVERVPQVQRAHRSAHRD